MSPVLFCNSVHEKDADLKPFQKGDHKVTFAKSGFGKRGQKATCESFNTHRCNMMGETQVMCGIIILLMQLFLVSKLTVDHVLPVVLAVLSGTAALTGGGFGLYAANTKLVKHIVCCMIFSVFSSILALGVLAKTAIDLKEIVADHADEYVLFEMVDVLMIVMATIELFAATLHSLLCLKSLRKSRYRHTPREITDIYEPLTTSTLWFVPSTEVNLSDLELSSNCTETTTSDGSTGRRRHFSSERTPTGQLISQDESPNSTLSLPPNNSMEKTADNTGSSEIMPGSENDVLDLRGSNGDGGITESTEINVEANESNSSHASFDSNSSHSNSSHASNVSDGQIWIKPAISAENTSV